MVPILSQINQVHTNPAYLPKIHLNIIHPTYVLVCLVVSFLLAFPPITCMHSPAHLTILVSIISFIIGEEHKL
jgi:hypothetical protein